MESASVVAVRDLLIEALEAACYPVGMSRSRSRGEEDVEIVATLVSAAIEREGRGRIA
jgi:hypothetical protein